MKKNKSVAVVIVTFNALKWIDKCLKSVASYHVIVVDNNSSDGTKEHILQNYPDISFFHQKKNLGFGKANNTGIKYAVKEGFNYVFLLNQDAYIQKNAIKYLIEIHKLNDSFGLLSPIHFNGKGDRLDRNFSNYLKYDNNAEFFGDAINGTLKDFYEVPFVNAAAWLIPIKTIEKIGGFDPIFFHYGEDDNYCQRVTYHKLKILIVSKSKINHDRENRKKPKFEPYSKKYFSLIESNYKATFGNILLENFIVKKQILKLTKKAFKMLLLLNFRFFIGILKEIYLLKKISPQISKSRKKNIEIGKHYI